MKTTISISAGLDEKSVLHRSLLMCGAFSSLLYVGMNLFVPTLFEGYSSASQTVSELSAIGAPTRRLWVVLGALYSVLIILFGWGVWRLAAGNRPLRFAGIFVLGYGIVSLFWPFCPMHQREVLAAGGGTLTDTLHLVLAGLSVFLMVMAMGFASAAFERSFLVYSIVTILILILFGLLTALDAPKVEANLPTPLAGVWERINIGVFLAWIVVLANVMLKKLNTERQVRAEIRIKTRKTRSKRTQEIQND